MVDRGLSIFALAERLGVHPLEVAAIVGHEHPLPNVLVFDEPDVAATAAWGGIERWWTETDAEPLRARFQRVLVRLLAADGAVRLDNALRGLGADDAQALRSALDELVEHDVLRRRDTLRGAMLTVGDRARAEAIRDARDVPEMIEKLLG
jgi:hypothetical protein